MLEWIGGTPVGLWLIPGIILMPIYGMLLAWFLGKPRNYAMALRGFVYLLAMAVMLWGGLFVLSMVIKFVFFQS
ncbi:MAG: hypothetical protein Q8Q07_03145 [Dehalococcoidales bacterium]|nr:hypothetical protein [Dehalococcoidales bacterium]